MESDTQKIHDWHFHSSNLRQDLKINTIFRDLTPSFTSHDIFTSIPTHTYNWKKNVLAWFKIFEEVAYMALHVVSQGLFVVYSVHQLLHSIPDI